MLYLKVIFHAPNFAASVLAVVLRNNKSVFGGETGFAANCIGWLVVEANGRCTFGGEIPWGYYHLRVAVVIFCQESRHQGVGFKEAPQGCLEE